MKNCTCVSLIWQFSSLCWCSQDYDVCFFGLRHCGRRCCARFFIWIYNVCKTRINFSMRVFVFFVLRHIENGFFNGSLCFFGFSTIENWFLNESLCFFGVKPIENWFFNESVCFFGFRPIENCFFNESLCFLGLRHCGRRRCARFFKWIYNVFRTRINFSMRVFVFLVSGLLKMDFSMRVFVFLA